jgi:hypothetical protein
MAEVLSPSARTHGYVTPASRPAKMALTVMARYSSMLFTLLSPKMGLSGLMRRRHARPDVL